jgi:hypothetical protein
MKAVNDIAASQAAPNGSLPRGSSLPLGHGRPVEAKQESERPCDSDPSANGGLDMDDLQGDRASESGEEGEARDQRLDVLIVDVDAGDARWAVIIGAAYRGSSSLIDGERVGS